MIYPEVIYPLYEEVEGLNGWTTIREGARLDLSQGCVNGLDAFFL